MPKSSKYPPLPWVPKGSLKVRTTQATLSRFHMGPNILFPNLEIFYRFTQVQQKVICVLKPQNRAECIRKGSRKRLTLGPWGSAPSPYQGNGLCGRSGPQWTERKDDWTIPLSSAGHGQTAFRQSLGSTLFKSLEHTWSFSETLLHYKLQTAILIPKYM